MTYTAPAPYHPAARFRGRGRGCREAGRWLRVSWRFAPRTLAAEARRLVGRGPGLGQDAPFRPYLRRPRTGTRRELSFTLAFADRPALPEAGFFLCQHGRPEHFWSAAAQVHPNGARTLGAVTLCLDANRPTMRPEIALPVRRRGGRIAPAGPRSRPTAAPSTSRTPDELDGAVAGRFAAFTVVVASLDVVRRLLDQARVPYRTPGRHSILSRGRVTRSGSRSCSRLSR